MKKFWLVAADSSRARFFEARDSGFEEVENLENEDARKYNRELNTDGPGRMDDDGTGKSATAESDRKSQMIDDFAGEVAEKLRKARAQGEYDQFSIVAAPKFLGRLRKKLDKATLQTMLEDVGKNVTDQSPEEISAHLTEKFGGSGITPTKPPA